MNYRISDEMLVLSTSLVCMKFCRQSEEQVQTFTILHRTTSIKRAADNKPTISGRLNAASRKHQAQEKLVKVVTVLYLHTSCMHTLRYRLTCLCTYNEMCTYTEMCFQINDKLILQIGHGSFDKLIMSLYKYE